MTEKEITGFTKKIRNRVMGLIFDDEDRILLIKHKHLLLDNEYFLLPPGGGVEFGETLFEALKREISEETNLNITKANYQFMNEFIEGPYHAIEHFFHVENYNGNPVMGTDPELPEYNQMILGLEWYSEIELLNIKSYRKHKIFNIEGDFEKLKTISQLTTVVSNQKNS
ncbi:NUDIX domain-containing protein [Marinigracilibium pacificum]|uniref:NUDIX hydrolase n=1 Tax=Marinigracilibium pacificum TaxID=2729599 RepID=A0A848J488_9BACT|nr:NUDIX hydrolase [Marinigracilibium pacificum]NMM50551.1 NUDIX hydrolase [Marinigracilibium pacificum]